MTTLSEKYPELITDKLVSRFWGKVDKSAGDEACWQWTGSVSGGNAFFHVGEVKTSERKKSINVQAHRFSYELAGFDPPDGVQVRRFCGNKLCVNPAHCRMHTDLESLFWSKVAKSKESDGCWFWLGAIGTSGYGELKLTDNRTLLAHRTAYEMTFGVKLTRQEYACHKCDNKVCCNPNHIFIGNAKDNQQDMAKKKRSAWGTRNGNTKLTPEQVQEIRRSSGSQYAIARKFGVSQTTIRRILTGETWFNLDESTK